MNVNELRREIRKQFPGIMVRVTETNSTDNAEYISLVVECHPQSIRLGYPAMKAYCCATLDRRIIVHKGPIATRKVVCSRCKSKPALRHRPAMKVEVDVWPDQHVCQDCFDAFAWQEKARREACKQNALRRQLSRAGISIGPRRAPKTTLRTISKQGDQRSIQVPLKLTDADTSRPV